MATILGNNPSIPHGPEQRNGFGMMMVFPDRKHVGERDVIFECENLILSELFSESARIGEKNIGSENVPVENCLKKLYPDY